jgi:hypothetical protein
MKKITTYTFLFWVLMVSIGANAQYCGSSQISACGSSPSYYGIGVLDSIPCVVRGGAMNNITTKIKIYNTFNSNAGRVNVLKLRIDSITNLPCGMCWSTNSPTNEFLADALCCLNIKGATNDQVGQYKMGFYLSVALTDTSTYDVTGVTADEGSIYLYLRVQNQGGACPHVDTSAGSQRLVSSCLYSGINEPSVQLRDLAMQPNPMSNEAKITFATDNGGDVHIKVISIVGSKVYDNTISAKAGINEIAFSRKSLPSGIYILSVGTSKGTNSRKFVIED